jgi:hypothetical protein
LRAAEKEMMARLTSLDIKMKSSIFQICCPKPDAVQNPILILISAVMAASMVLFNLMIMVRGIG